MRGGRPALGGPAQRSIDNRLAMLQERLVSAHGGGGLGGGGGGRGRPRLGLSIPASPPVSAAHIETDARLREIHSMSGALNVDGREYRSRPDDLERLGELGSGTCGQVVKMLHRPSGAIIAVKIMRRSGNTDENKRILMDLEIVLRSHDCPYIVRCLGYFITDVEVWICMELMKSCFDKILKHHAGPVPEDIIGKVTVATVKALSYLKDEHGVIHRDVKPSNILVDNQGTVKLCDFGISGRLVDSKAKTRGAGCAAYMAPERINPPDPQKPDYDIRADVWSLGITLVELATGNYPYRDCANDFEVLTKVIQEEPPALPDGQAFSDEFKSFVRQCLTKDYLQRPKYAALLDHPFVSRASQSEMCVANWLASALPPDSPRSNPTPPIIRRRHQNNSIGEKKLSEENSSSHSTPSSDKNSSFSLKRADQSDKISNNCTPSMESEINTSLSNLNVQNDSDKNHPDRSDNSASSSSDSKKSEERKSSLKKIKVENAKNTSDNLVSHKNVPIVPPQSEFDAPPSKEPPPRPSFPQSPRDRSHSNTMAHHSSLADRWPFNKHATNSKPSTKHYFDNLEMRSQPFSGGGPSSFDNSYNRHRDIKSSGYRFGSPEVGRRRAKPSAFDFRNRECESARTAADGRCENVAYAEAPANPQFRTNAPTNYFASSTAVIRYKNSLMMYNGGGGGGYHQNPGGSCSQPASLEAYGDGRHSPRGFARTPENSFSPPLRSPQPAPRWATHRREEREDKELWRNAEINQIGNTSPIVLQRFYHQQSQRRSRRDWDSSSRQSSLSLSRDTSIGRSPEPPRRAYRDPSLPRDNLAFAAQQHAENPFLREWRERERAPSQHRLSSSKNDSIPSIADNDLQQQQPPPHYINSMVERKDVFNGDMHYNSIAKNSTYHHHMRENCQSELSNGHSPDVIANYASFGKEPSKSNAERPPPCVENKKEKDKKHKKERHENRDENCCNSNSSQRNGKSCSKEKDDQGWLNSIAGIMKRRFASYVKLHLGANNNHHAGGSGGGGGGVVVGRSSSPSGGGASSCHARVSRLPMPRRIGTISDYASGGGSEAAAKALQDCPHSIVTGLRLSGGPPLPPPRKATESWSLPASPLPTRPI